LLVSKLRPQSSISAVKQVEGDPDAAAEKRKTISYKDVEALAMSFRCIAHIDHLQGFTSLRKLQLDNNRISSIQNLSHLVWYHI
jgi:hypothetical protein